MSSICLISANSLEYENASRNRVLSFINSFIEEGYNVKLISMDRDEFDFYENEKFEHFRVPFIDTKIPSFIKRAFLELRLASRVLKKANELNCDINLITIPSMFLLHLSYLLKQDKTKVLDIRDLSWEYLDENSIINRIAKKGFTISALLNVKKFDVISVTNDHEYDYISKNINKNTKIVKVPNGVSLEIFNRLSEIIVSNNKALTVTYVGNVGLAQDLSTFIEVSKILPNVNFNIVGEGTDFNRISLLSEPNQKNLKFWGRKKFDELIDIYNNTDVLYAQLTSDFSSAMPSKLYEYLSTGKYVIYGGRGVAESTLKRFNNVSIIDSCNVDLLKDEIIKLMNNSSYKGLSLKNRELIKSQYIRDNTVKNLISEIKG